MLPYFPVPYPDELWYSTLCRYHVRSGNINTATTFQELFESRKEETYSCLLPDGGIRKVAAQLPVGTLDVDEIARKHTLFSYVFRFQTLETKQKLLCQAKNGDIKYLVKLPKQYWSRSLKCCPVCMKEDLGKYGETYWHLSHQIPSATICTKHRCRLLNYSQIVKKHRNDSFVLPEPSEEEPVFDIPRAEIELNEMFQTYLELPLEYSPTPDRNNLFEGLLDVGYRCIRMDKKYAVDYKKLELDLWDYFGKDLIIRVFGTTNLRSTTMAYIRNWEYKLPERYALLATFIHQKPEITFALESQNRLKPNHPEILLPQKDLSMDKLNKCKRYIGFTQEEWEYIEKQTKLCKMQSPSVFIRSCVEEHRKQKVM